MLRKRFLVGADYKNICSQGFISKTTFVSVQNGKVSGIWKSDWMKLLIGQGRGMGKDNDKASLWWRWFFDTGLLLCRVRWRQTKLGGVDIGVYDCTRFMSSPHYGMTMDGSSILWGSNCHSRVWSTVMGIESAFRRPLIAFSWTWGG